MILRRRVIHAVLLAACLLPAGQVEAQEPAKPQPGPLHEHVSVPGTLLTPTRETTGTSWLPQDTPMFGVHRPWRGWDLRLDGAAFGFVVVEPGDRHRTGGPGEVEFALPNWGMVAVRRGVGSGRFGVRVMLSAEPLTLPGCGALSYIAVGEVCEGDTIHDRQQPHDALMELAADYERPLRGGWRWQVYAGLAGEPALGPPRASHRSSGVLNPIAPVTHHWLESTPTAFGVVTAGLHNGRWKAEASAFNGRDPDESRGDLDLGGLDSFAGRVSFLPADNLALQVSAGRVRSAMLALMRPSDSFATEATASIVYHRRLPSAAVWATTIAVGANRRPLHIVDVPDDTTFAGLLESSLSLSGRHTFFGRLEMLQMPAHHLHALEHFTTVFGLAKVQAGYVREVRAGRTIVPGVGVTAALSLLPPALESRYSTRTAPTFGVFLSLRPPPHKM